MLPGQRSHKIRQQRVTVAAVIIVEALFRAHKMLIPMPPSAGPFKLKAH